MLKRASIAVLFGFGLAFSDVITFEYVCDYPEYGPSFFGFPFVYRTSTPWVNSMSAVLYVTGSVGNLLFWTTIVYLVASLVEKLKRGWTRRVVTIILSGICILSLGLTTVELAIIEWGIETGHDDFKMNYYQDDIDCERTVKFLPLK